MATVAKAAAVSHQTVSNVINAPHLVRPETRERVEAVIAQTGYRPLKAAQMLRTQRSQLIAVIIPEPGKWHGELHNAFLHALTRRAQKSDYRVLLFTAADDGEEISAYDQLLSDYELDAFVLTGTHSGDRRTSWLHRKHIPFVTFGRPWGSSAGHPWVDVDGAFGERLATEHLIAAGHRRIAFLGWPEGSGVGDDRRSGWEQALRAAGLATADLGAGDLGAGDLGAGDLGAGDLGAGDLGVAGLRAAVEDEVAQGRAACASLLDGPRPPTAFVGVSDTIALGAWTEIVSRGMVPGTDCAVIGFDDSSAAAAVGLTSVAQPLDEVADACLVALGKLLATGRKRRPPPDRVLLRPRLVLRSSA